MSELAQLWVPKRTHPTTGSSNRHPWHLSIPPAKPLIQFLSLLLGKVFFCQVSQLIWIVEQIEEL